MFNIQHNTSHFRLILLRPEMDFRQQVVTFMVDIGTGETFLSLDTNTVYSNNSIVVGCIN